VAGSIDKRERILAGKATVEEVYNEGKDALYKWKRVGDILPVMTPPRVHPDVLRSGDASALQAAEALVKAQTDPQWGQKNMTRNKKMTERLTAQLESFRHFPEVADFLKRLQSDAEHVDSRELHYIQRRYLDGREFANIEALDALYQRIIQDPDAKIYQAGGNRYQVRSVREGWIAIIEPNGERVSIYPDLGDDFGDPLWNQNNLIL
jgi:hypothetical protein